uniref:Uncharacterized protein n=1 Tax=Amphimedon queenslandica TaxID=400682 RepID=A0A1X7TFE9_AMPQE
MKECLYGLLKDEGEDDPDSTENWIETTDRGGLHYITDLAFELFVEIEIFVYHQLSQSQQQTTHELTSSACRDPDILQVWGKCIIEYDDNETEILLNDIVKEWIKVRGHSMAIMEMEQHKRKKNETSKKRSLRTELRRDNNQDEN